MTSKQYIDQQLDRQMLKAEEEYNRVTSCEHKFEQHGFGYKCKCGYYTGTNIALNALIEHEKREEIFKDSANFNSLQQTHGGQSVPQPAPNCLTATSPC